MWNILIAVVVILFPVNPKAVRLSCDIIRCGNPLQPGYWYLLLCASVCLAYPNYKFTQFKQTAASKCKQNSFRFPQESQLTNQTGKRSKSTKHCIAKPYWHILTPYSNIDSSLSQSRNRSRLDSPALPLHFLTTSSRCLPRPMWSKTKRVGQRSSFQPVPKLSEAPLSVMCCFSKSELSAAVPKSPCQESRIKQTPYDLCWVLLDIIDLQWVRWYQYGCLWRSAKKYRNQWNPLITISTSRGLKQFAACPHMSTHSWAKAALRGSSGPARLQSISTKSLCQSLPPT